MSLTPEAKHVSTFPIAQFGASLTSRTAPGERKRNPRHVCNQEKAREPKMLMKEERHRNGISLKVLFAAPGADMIRKKSSYYGHRREFVRKCVRPISRKEYPARKLIALVVRWLHVVFNFFFCVCGLPSAFSLFPYCEI
jgi:hypothetical protein